VEIGTIPEDFQDIMDGKQLPQIWKPSAIPLWKTCMKPWSSQ
jgi:hypothetical protein